MICSRHPLISLSTVYSHLHIGEPRQLEKITKSKFRPNVSRVLCERSFNTYLSPIFVSEPVQTKNLHSPSCCFLSACLFVCLSTGMVCRSTDCIFLSPVCCYECCSLFFFPSSLARTRHSHTLTQLRADADRFYSRRHHPRV